jgi:pSer/pThr/pTyr-binding forkhead associated (FHA) protein
MPLTPILGDAPDVRAELVVDRGPAPCRGRRAVVGEQVLVGRGAHCSLLLPDETVSPSHCRVFRSRTGSRYWVEDLDSLNGTRVNDREINRRTVLRDGDRLALGRTTLAFNLLAR